MIIESLPAQDTNILHISDVIDATSFQKVSNFINKSMSTRPQIVIDSSDIHAVEYIRLKIVFDAIKECLVSNISKDVKLTGFMVTKNRSVIQDWHFHAPEFLSDPKPIIPEKFWVSVYYLHEKWDDVYGGNLLVGKTKDNPIARISCKPNSGVIHNATIGHGVDWLNLKEANTNRIVMYSHWIEI